MNTLITFVVLLIAAGTGAAIATVVVRRSAATTGAVTEQALMDKLADKEALLLAERETHRTQIAGLTGQLQQAQESARLARVDADDQRKLSQEMENRLTPLSEAFNRLNQQVAESESARREAAGKLSQRVVDLGQQVKTTVEGVKADVKEAAKEVQTEASRLNRALTASGRRGSWGEMQLKRVIESAGMIDGVHFQTQDHRTDGEQGIRPDMVVQMVGGRNVVVDSKVSLDAFLNLETDSEDDLAAAKQKHADAVAQHVKTLSKKQYWDKYDTPEFVVMFMPAESLLSVALEVRPTLLQEAFDNRVILATPTTLLAVLHTVSYTWQQERVATQAREVLEIAVELHNRFATMGNHFASLGKSLDTAAKNYNKTVASYESRVAPKTAQLSEIIGKNELDPVDVAGEQIRELRPSKWGQDEVAELEMADPVTTEQEIARLARLPREGRRESA